MSAPVREIILYDGVCAMCSALVRFVLPRDRDDRFRYAALQGALAREVLARHGRNPDDLDTLYVVLELGTPAERLLGKARAALHVCRHLRAPWWLLAGLGVLPTWLLDWAYDRVARARYRLFGRSDVCRLPSPADREKFLDPA